MRSKIIAFLKYKEYNEVLLKSKDYFKLNKIEDINTYRVKKFNLIWEDAYKNIKFYKKLKQNYMLPDRISKLDDIKLWPIISKNDLQENEDDLKRSYSSKKQILTGGSTGQPLRLGCHSGIETAANQWIGRSFTGLKPGSKGFLVWGHHHLYGKSLFRYLNIIKRTFFDFIMNYKRVSGYDFSAKLLRKNFKKLIRYNPDYILGYSSAVLALCRANFNEKEFVKNLNIKLVICSGGRLNSYEKREIQNFFNSKVIMEYGSAECGAMAYTNSTLGNYKIFWDTHIFEPVVYNNEYKKNIVTTLSERYFPLIRYDIGDFIETVDENPFPIEVRDIYGRPSEILEFSNGVKIYFLLINDVFKQNKKIKALQLSTKENTLNVYLLLSSKLLKNEEDELIKKCIFVAPGLKNIKFKIIEKKDLLKTPSGKIRSII